MPSVDTILFVSVVFLIAGFVKGVIGLGLRPSPWALLAATIGLKPAVAVLILPALATNAIQAMTGSSLLEIVRRTWTFILVAFVCTWLGASILAGSTSPAFCCPAGPQDWPRMPGLVWPRRKLLCPKIGNHYSALLWVVSPRW